MCFLGVAAQRGNEYQLNKKAKTEVVVVVATAAAGYHVQQDTASSHTILEL